MSTHQRYSNKGLPNKTHQQRFIPKSSQPINPNPNPNPNPTLSDSLRKQQSLSSSSSSSGNFVNYLPQDEAVAAGLGAKEGGLDPLESQRVVDLLNKECSRLLKLNPKEFWKQVANDTSLHAFLESFLKYRSRWYDFPSRGAKGIVAGVIVGEHELNRRVFMILYRMSSNRDPGAKASDSLSAKDHAVILQEKKLLDLPKLLDICAIYGHENEELTRLIVNNAIKAQPSIHDSFTAAISHFLNIVHTMFERCTTSLEVLFLSREAQDTSFTRLHTDYLEIMDFINDAIVSMDALVTAYNYAAVYFSSLVETSYGSDEMLKLLARLHDSLLPALQQGFRIIFTSEKDKLAEVFVSLKMLASRIVKFSWNLLNHSYLSEDVFKERAYFPFSSKIFPAQVEDPVIRSDILVQTFQEISEECSTVHEGKNAMSLLQSVQKSYQLMTRLELLGNQGWILMDDEQLRFLSGIISVSSSANVLHLPSNKAVEMDEDNAITESKISQVKDLFPDYGNGFISACLDVYNDNPEEVIQRILEGTLDKDLQSLDTTLAVLPAKTTAPPVGIKDKGKGKLVEPELDYAPPKPKIEGPSSTSSSSSVGRFVRKSTANVPDSEILNSKDEKSKSFALNSLLEYEDEYDDSFDDLGLSVGDTGLDDLSEKVTSNEVSASDASKWGSRQKPQFYVKDGKNYSYKVSGSVAAANYNEASIVNQAQKELIHGLGRGGNFPLGAAQKVMEVNERKYDGEQIDKKDVNAPMRSNKGQYDEQGGRGRGRGRGRGNIGKEQNMNPESNEGGGRGRGWGRGRGRGRGSIGKEQNVTADSNEGEDSNGSIGERGRGGRGRGGRRGGGRSNNYRKDQAMKKHLSGLGGF